MRFRRLYGLALIIASSVLAAAPASAHHVMGGKTPTSFVEGLLSGLGLRVGCVGFH